MTGIDLSEASLAYARRMANQLGVDNATFVHGDLMDAASLGRHFDVIVANGVLHHMADPAGGWQALASTLRPGGLMKVGLYSAAARRVIVAARQLVSASGWEPDVQSIRAFREMTG